ncbi:MAG: 30S ribosomal protein S9 [Verrucomicrobiota bacterium]
MSKTDDSNTFTATGRRKTAVARVIMEPGEGKIFINDRPYEEYFPTVALQNIMSYPFHAVNAAKKWDVRIRTHGGGLSGQVGAARLAISRALLKSDPELRGQLKEEGLLTRDSRMKERKKPGQPGARKRFQFSKR